MKKAILTFGLLSLVMILTSFTTPEKTNPITTTATTVNINGGQAAGGNQKVDINGGQAAGGNQKVDINGGQAAGGNQKVDINGGQAAGGNQKVD